MGLFLKITADSQGAETIEKARLNNSIINNILDGLNDYAWQDRISSQLRALNPQFSHITLGIILRLFLQKNIEIGHLKSYSRYLKKDDKLVIDQMLCASKYAILTEDQTRVAMCDDVFLYFEAMLLKYTDKFQDFDVVAFIPLLKQRLEEIKLQQPLSEKVP